MKFEIDSKSADVVDGFGAVGRWVQLSSIALVCIALPIGFDLILAYKKEDPFDPASEAYPAVPILIFGIPIFLFGYCFYYLRKGFRNLVLDPVERTMQMTWQGLFGQWKESIPFTSIRGFSGERIAISEYRYGWELRAELGRGRQIRLAQFYKEEDAIEAVKSANAVLTTEEPLNQVS